MIPAPFNLKSTLLAVKPFRLAFSLGFFAVMVSRLRLVKSTGSDTKIFSSEASPKNPVVAPPKSIGVTQLTRSVGLENRGRAKHTCCVHTHSSSFRPTSRGSKDDVLSRKAIRVILKTFKGKITSSLTLTSFNRFKHRVPIAARNLGSWLLLALCRLLREHLPPQLLQDDSQFLVFLRPLLRLIRQIHRCRWPRPKLPSKHAEFEDHFISYLDFLELL